MCHSVDMYMPEASRRAAEERILEANAAAAAREQRVVDAVCALLARLRHLLGSNPAGDMTQERVKHG